MTEVNQILQEAGIIDEEPVGKRKRGRPKKKVIKETESIEPQPIESPSIEEYRSKLGCVVASGQSKAFIGKSFTIAEINNMSENDINKYYRLYESTYSTLVSDNIVNGFLDGSSKLFSYILPIDDASKLSTDLKSNFLVTSELRKLTGRLSFCFGPALALISGSFVISKHIELKAKPIEILPDEVPNEESIEETVIITTK